MKLNFLQKPLSQASSLVMRRAYEHRNEDSFDFASAKKVDKRFAELDLFTNQDSAKAIKQKIESLSLDADCDDAQCVEALKNFDSGGTDVFQINANTNKATVRFNFSDWDGLPIKDQLKIILQTLDVFFALEILVDKLKEQGKIKDTDHDWSRFKENIIDPFTFKVLEIINKVLGKARSQYIIWHSLDEKDTSDTNLISRFINRIKDEMKKRAIKVGSDHTCVWSDRHAANNNILANILRDFINGDDKRELQDKWEYFFSSSDV